MHTTSLGWATRILSRLLRDGYGHSLLGDLAEEHERRRRSGSAREAAQWYRNQVYSSLAAVLRLCAVEFVRTVPWGIALAAYLLVGVLEFGSRLLLSRVWPELAHPISAVRLLIEFPGIVCIAYLAARSHRSAAFVLGAMMLVAAVLITTISTEAMSTAYVSAFLTVGPLAALLGGMLHRRRMTVASAGLVLLVTAGSTSAQEKTPVTDPSKTTYGEMNPQAAKELNAFAFLIGTWDGQGRTRLANGKVAEYPVTWIGRYILDGTAIADEVHAPAPDGSRHMGITFRQYDPNRRTWVIEFLNVTGSFLRRQVHPGAGSVIVSGRNVIVMSESPGAVVREHYLVPDNDSWVYRLDVSNDGGKSWNDGGIEFSFRRSK